MDKPTAPNLPKGGPVRFVREVVAELKKVNWPTRQETVKLTVAVILISIAVGIFIGSLDALMVKITSFLF